MYPLAVLYEAEENECQEALMLVHSFSREQSGLADFQAFARALGLCSDVGDLGDPIRRLGVNLRLGWVLDLPSAV